MIRVILVDDQVNFRTHLRQLVNLAGMEVVGEAGDIPSAEQIVIALKPDLAIVDIMLPGINGIAGTPILKSRAQQMDVILISAYKDEARNFEALAREAGAVFFVSKDDLDLELFHSWAKAHERFG